MVREEILATLILPMLTANIIFTFALFPLVIYGVQSQVIIY